MKATLLPLRFRILHYLATVSKASAEDVLQALKPEYGKEKQFTKEAILDHLLSMKANFIIDDKNEAIDSKGELVVYYSINDEGKMLLTKYLPREWK